MKKALTKRQEKVLALLASGFNNGQIAKKMRLHPKTIESHRAAVYKKLGIRNTVMAVHAAISCGLVTVLSNYQNK